MGKDGVKSFFNKLLNGVALGIVVGLIPNAVLGGILKFFINDSSIIKMIYNVLGMSQLATPALIGILVALQFKMQPIEVAISGMVSFICGGSISIVDGKMIINGIGDLINIMIVSAVLVLVMQFFRGKFGSLTIILLPVLTTAIVGTFGLTILPYVKKITGFIGSIIMDFTTLQPLLMSILLAISFALIIVSPVSTVAVSIAVGLQGLASGAANVGIASCAMTLVVGTMRVNKIGVPLSLFFGSMKIFMPNWLKYPIVNIPIIINAVFAGFLAYYFTIQGTAASAGFGFSGLIGPIAAFQFMQGSILSKITILFIVYFMATFVFALITDFIFVKILKIYKRDIFIFEELGK
ncbi:PTS transporter subunit IIC [Gemella sp. zg-570]|uniref:PTS transporter subunit IIC n=1 Tax=unclassified Gemella TaxID=2624949 RepID=UPI001C0430A6|nr:PTS sugar transporter subunit IIC [Gemella sp. zg-570]MBU0278958.1 PTS sugar transporter subunit IIC [Gemella sp. zg-1178]QWQ39066.1 PTS sugar transporter subunit IIC [Gemella sp. zg-570]